MVAERKRNIRDGAEYDHLFPLPDNTDTRVKGNASVEDTLKLIQETVPQTLWHTEKIARKLRGRTLNETCSNIWHFVYGHIQYKRDEDGVEQIRSPRRTWWERKTGVDCDCYTEFILSILLNLRIASIARITKYPKKPPEVPTWQHIYVIVPKDGRTDESLSNRDDYLVIDCVKNEYDDEQPFLEHKDFTMRLDYLDGLDKTEVQEDEYASPVEFDSVDAEDLAAIYGFDDIGSLKSFVKKVGSAVKTAVKKVGEVAKKVGDKIGDGIRVINRFVNPVTILLRNGFLLAMKVNMFNVAGRLRYAYLSDAQAKAMGMNMDSLNKLRKVKDRAETVYWQAGGKKDNLKKAILSGKGNKDKKVQLSGLFGVDDVYMDMDEYNIIHSDPDNLEGLGEIATGTALAAATSAVAAVSAALKQIKGLFNKGGQEEAAFQSEKDNAGSASDAPAFILESEDEIHDENEIEPPPPSYASPQSNQPTLPASADTKRVATDLPASPQNNAIQPAGNNEGFIQKTTAWVKLNPGKSLLIAGAVLGTGFLVIRGMQGSSTKSNGLSGLNQNRKKKRRRKKKKTHKSKSKIQSIKL